MKSILDQVFHKFCCSILHKGGSTKYNTESSFIFVLLLKQLVSIVQLKCDIIILEFINFDQIKNLRQNFFKKFWRNCYSSQNGTNIQRPDRCFHWFLSSFSYMAEKYQQTFSVICSLYRWLVRVSYLSNSALVHRLLVNFVIYLTWNLKSTY